MKAIDVKVISALVSNDKEYKHFAKRIKKDFENASDSEKLQTEVIYLSRRGKKIGFAVLSSSFSKMKLWLKTFKDEDWVAKNFKISKQALELKYMYLKKELRDKGYGHKLFKKITRYVRKQKKEELYAYVSDRNPQSLSFYKNLGGQVIVDLSDEETTSAFLRWKI